MNVHPSFGFTQNSQKSIPLHPTVNNIHQHNFFIFCSPIFLQIFQDDLYFVKDSWEFHNFIRKQTIPKSFSLVSFDNTSLSKNTPVDLASDCIRRRWDKIKNFSPLIRDPVMLVGGLMLVLSITYFFNNKNFLLTWIYLFHREVIGKN